MLTIVETRYGVQRDDKKGQIPLVAIIKVRKKCEVNFFEIRRRGFNRVSESSESSPGRLEVPEERFLPLYAHYFIFGATDEHNPGIPHYEGT
jgi:hypothetical protein